MAVTEQALHRASTAQRAASPRAASRQRVRARYRQDEPEIVAELLAEQPFDEGGLEAVRRDAIALVERLRRETSPTLMENFLGEYGLSTREGVGLMCLAEALLRVPDATTLDELIADKIERSDWASHLGQSGSPLVNASTWALMLTGRLLDDDDDPVTTLRPLLRRLGEPLVRSAAQRSMALLGKQFVLGRTIEEATREARSLERKGYTYSYDMLGEAARTDADARRYHRAYADAIAHLAKTARGERVRDRPGISVKLSALDPRYERVQRERVMRVLVPRARELMLAAARANIGFNIDAEEAERLDLSLDVIEALLASEELGDWEGFGVVVQAYGRRALPVIDHLALLAREHGRRIMVRLVKGAYWDTEVKEAQVLGLASFPVFTKKDNTDLSYLVCAARLLEHRDLIYPQFATHNAHSSVAVRRLAGEADDHEFQRLHGMGEALHETLRAHEGTRCRVYAPVGAHTDLLAYLVRRLLENGANSSFVHRLVDPSIAPEDVVACPVAAVRAAPSAVHPTLRHPLALYAPARVNSKGYRLNDPPSVEPLLAAREAFADTTWRAAPMLAEGASDADGDLFAARLSPTDPERTVGHARDASATEVEAALAAGSRAAREGRWAARTVGERAAILRAASERYEEATPELVALLCREAGKTLDDAVAELREAVDFLRYYAVEAGALGGDRRPRGLVVCVSPWNFPLAIFTGQIAGALAAGCTVIAKPAEQTPLVAARAVALMREAGVPPEALQLLPGDGAVVGAALTADPRVDGVCFTGSTDTARLIERALAAREAEDLADGATADPMLIAETGGLNAMIVDSTALPEQVVRDVVMSAFRSAGQRCSALRMLYVQKEALSRVLEMLKGAVDVLAVGDPWSLATDVGPLIDAEATAAVTDWIEARRGEGAIEHEGRVAAGPHFVAPTIVRVDGIEALTHEVFGPVLHVASFDADELERVVDAVNARGYGLTFGLHTRIDDRVTRVVERAAVGNVYVNRNQIGAVVGTQPFGGEGLSGTGPKAGGPLYLARFTRPGGGTGATAATADESSPASADTAPVLDAAALAAALAAQPAPDGVARGHALAAGGRSMPGPTGESNRYTVHPRGQVLLLAEHAALAARMIEDARAGGCAVLVVVPELELAETLAARHGDDGRVVVRHGRVAAEALAALDAAPDLVAVATAEPARTLACRRALAARDGAIVPLVVDAGDVARYVIERHVCIDTTAAGGNASLLAASG